MAIIRVYEIRKLTKDDRAKRLSELKAELSKLMATKAMGGSIENPGRIRLLKKTIARFNTVTREEELGIAPNTKAADKPAKAEKAKSEAKIANAEEAAPAAKPEAARRRQSLQSLRRRRSPRRRLQRMNFNFNFNFTIVFSIW